MPTLRIVASDGDVVDELVFTADEWEDIQTAADKAGLTIEEWVIRTLRMDATAVHVKFADDTRTGRRGQA